MPNLLLYPACTLLVLALLYTGLTSYVICVSKTVKITRNHESNLYNIEMVIENYRDYKTIVIGFFPNNEYRKKLTIWNYFSKLIYYNEQI